MAQHTRFVGLDVHAATIAVAVAEEGTEAVRSMGTIPHTVEAVARVMRKLGSAATVRVCYEAGPCGYGLYWQLTALGVACTVVAPTLIPVRAGDRVKTDRRDAEKLARCFRQGDLTAVWVPTPATEALRDLVRARESAKLDQLRARHRLSKFLLRRGCQPPEQLHAWGTRHLAWMRTQHFGDAAQEATFQDYLQEVDHVAERLTQLEHAIGEAIEAAEPTQRAVIAGLQALRGVSALTAVTLVAEVGTFSRFTRPKQLMGYAGMVSREDSSGTRIRRGAITKTGNAHVRRVVGEAAWTARYRPAVSPVLKRRQAGLPAELRAIAWRAQQRLHARYRRLLGRGKVKQQVVTAVGRELLGFIGAIAVHVERQHDGPGARLVGRAA